MRNSVGTILFVIWSIVNLVVSYGQETLPETLAEAVTKLQTIPLDMVNEKSSNSIFIHFGLTDGDWLAGSIAVLYTSKASDGKTGKAKFSVIGTEKMVGFGEFDMSKECSFEMSDALGQLLNFSRKQMLDFASSGVSKKQTGSGKKVFFFETSSNNTHIHQYILYDSDDQLPPEFRTLAEWVYQRCLGFAKSEFRQSIVPRQLLKNADDLKK